VVSALVLARSVDAVLDAIELDVDEVELLDAAKVVEVVEVLDEVEVVDVVEAAELVDEVVVVEAVDSASLIINCCSSILT